MRIALNFRPNILVQGKNCMINQTTTKLTSVGYKVGAVGVKQRAGSGSLSTILNIYTTTTTMLWQLCESSKIIVAKELEIAPRESMEI